MTNYKEGNLEILLSDQDGKISMKWIGESDDRDPSSLLNPYLDKFVETIKGKNLEIDFQKLKYMNSSSVPPIIDLMKKLSSENVKSVILYDKNLKWQCASFKALETIASTLKSISIESK